MDIIPNKKIGFCTHSIGIKNAVIIKIRLMVPLKSILFIIIIIYNRFNKMRLYMQVRLHSLLRLLPMLHPLL